MLKQSAGDNNFAAAHVEKVAHLFRLSRYQEAFQTAREALTQYPDDSELWNLAGCAADALRLWDDAERFWRTAILKQPDNVQAQHNLGLRLFRRNRLDEAEAVFRRLLTREPNRATALNDLGAVLLHKGSYQEALAIVGHAIRLAPRAAGAYNNQGIIQTSLEHFDAAAASFREAVALRPDFAEAHTNLGILCLQLGRAVDAEANFNAALAADRDYVLAYFQLATLGVLGEGDPRLEQLRSLFVRRQSLTEVERVAVNFAIGKVMERLGKYDEAFTAFEEGNRVHHLGHPCDERTLDRIVTWTTSNFTAKFFDECLATADALPRHDDDRVPIFIVGMPRSGTTLIEQMLASHPGIFGAGELTDLDQGLEGFEFPQRGSPDWKLCLSSLRKLGDRYMNSVWKRSPQSRFISNKLPGNYRWLGWIRLMLPNAKIIHCQREPLDTLLSCYTTLFNAGHDYAYDLGTLGRYCVRYRQLMEHWQSVLPPGATLDVRYEDIVENPEREVRRMLSHVGLPWDSACLQFHENRRAVKTASFRQVREPIYSTSVSRWKHFEKYLGPLQAVVDTAVVPSQ